MSNTFEFTCMLCEAKFDIDAFGDGDCPGCGVSYKYEEYQMLNPTPEEARDWAEISKKIHGK